jgi:predicted amidophosphoribosyltransferase
MTPADGPAEPPAMSHCTSCGRPVAACPGCGRALDPPRYCATCGTRLAVRVTPRGWVGRCKHHGEVARS